jgi:predicted lipoprotein with Yx(FWY)xxD motif
VIGKPNATKQAQSADLSTTSRPDGQLQVTYKGHPLYYFVKDKDAGDAYGQALDNFGAEWYVLAPSGNKIDEDKGS